MKQWNRVIASAVLLALGAGAYCQESDLVARCLGKPLSVYAKTFNQPGTETRKTPQGTETYSEYKTGSARIDVIQSPGAKVPNIVNLGFYQQPKYDWKLALKVAGLSSAGVTAKVDSKHKVHLSHVKAPHAIVASAVFVPMSDKYPDGPELHITLKKK